MLFDAAFDSPFTAATPPTVDFVVTRDGSTEEDAAYDVDPLVDTANPFGDYCVVKIDDRGGTKFEQYARGTRIDVEIRSDLGIIDRFTGYVVERRELDQQGADALEVEAYSFDQFLRRNTVTNDQSGKTIADALEDIIKTDTPVTFNASQIQVGDDQELTRTYQGEPVEQALRDFAFKSENEEFGVDDDLEFFFRPREDTHIDRGIDNTQWFNYDIPELGKEAINEVEVWYNDGEESVIVDDGTDKLDLQDSLDLPDPGTQRAELQRPLITELSDAEDIGRKYLEFRSSTLSGTVTTFGLFDAEPGDTIDIAIDARGIDTEFVIAAVEYRWSVDETVLTIVEKRGDVDDILADLSESVQRVEMEGANRDAPQNRITSTNARAIITPAADADGTAPGDIRLVNDGRRAARDGWRGAGLPDIATIAVGDDPAGLSRSNTALQNRTNDASVSVSLPDATTAEFSASITQSGVSEIGLFTASGTLVARGVFNSPTDIGGTVTVTLGVSNDDSISRGVLTTDGQTAVRDVLADNGPNIPESYAYGSDGAEVSESDAALGNEVIDQDLDRVLLGSADSDSEWESRTPTFDDDVPLGIRNGQLTQLQTTQFTEAEDATFVGTLVTNSDVPGGLSSDEGVELEIVDDVVQFEFTPEYDIPSGEAFADAFVTYDSWDGKIELSINGQVEGSDARNGVTAENTLADSQVSQALPAGETHQFEVRLVEQNSGSAYIDTLQVIDDGQRFGGFNIDRLSSFDADTASFAAPQLFPDLQEVALQTYTTTRDITEADVTSTWDDTGNKQFIELSNDGSTFDRTNNSETASATFGSAETDLDVRVGLSRYAQNTVNTPTVGDSSQQIDVLDAFANPESLTSDDIGGALTRIVIPPGTITGQTIREAGLKSGSTLLTRHQLADFEVLAGQQLASSERTDFNGPE